MPFVPLTLSDAFGSRFGTTGITGSLNPSVVQGDFFIGASIGAGPPFGIITTTTSWGFDAGLAPPGTTNLVVTADGIIDEAGETFTIGGYASAEASLSITIEEFQRVDRQADRPQAGGTVHLPRDTPGIARFETGRLALVRSVTGAVTPFIHIWSGGLGFQALIRTFELFSPVGVMPITPGLFYRCWFNACGVPELGHGC